MMNILIFALLQGSVVSFSPLLSSKRTTSFSRTSLSMIGVKGSALIVQNKGGGHGEIGYQLCQSLISAHPELEITLLQDKCNYKKAPFSSYSKLQALGIKIVDAEFSGSNSPIIPAEITNKKIDYIIDNFSKGNANATYFIDMAKKAESKQYLFVSSAGMYKSSPVLPHVETDPVKTNDVREVEIALEASGLPFTFFRPQYIYGPNANKRYLDFFIGRAARKLPIPLPLSGEQLVCLSHVEDVSTMIAAAVGQPKALNQVFNCGTDRFIGYRALALLCHEALGNAAEEAKFMYYDPKSFEHWKAATSVSLFPFRKETFITSPSKAKLLLDWTPKHTLKEDIVVEIESYAATGGVAAAWGQEELRNDIELHSSKDHKFDFTYPSAL